MAWWTNNGTIFPKLAEVIRKYLGTPSTFVPREQVFSAVGLICDDRKCSLCGVNAEKLCFFLQLQFETVELLLLNSEQYCLLLAVVCLVFLIL